MHWYRKQTWKQGTSNAISYCHDAIEKRAWFSICHQFKIWHIWAMCNTYEQEVSFWCWLKDIQNFHIQWEPRDAYRQKLTVYARRPKFRLCKCPVGPAGELRWRGVHIVSREKAFRTIVFDDGAHWDGGVFICNPLIFRATASRIHTVNAASHR